MHIKGRTFLLYMCMPVKLYHKYLKKKSQIISGMNIAMLLIWYQTAKLFRPFFLKRQNSEASVMHMEAYSHSHYVSEACQTLKFLINSSLGD